jgi:hypothetical protein
VRWFEWLKHKRRAERDLDREIRVIWSSKQKINVLLGCLKKKRDGRQTGRSEM